MTNFIQMHILVSYPPANLNRDDLGRPKTAIMGGSQRLRISSQSLKRAWRESETFSELLRDHIGIRTKTMGGLIKSSLTSGIKLSDIIRNVPNPPKAFTPLKEEQALEIAQRIAGEYGKLRSDDPNLKIEQLAFFSTDEIAAIEKVIEQTARGGKLPEKLGELQLLQNTSKAADIAMFGRMLADKPAFNVEAAVQVSHAITVHDVAVEDDYFTAVDDLNRGESDLGAGHVGETAFASGLFYIYICINKDLLIENLGKDAALARTAVQALTEAAAKVAPTGKQASFASRAYASYLLAEKGTQQPRSLSVAFLTAIRDRDLMDSAIRSLKETRDKMDRVYGSCTDSCIELNAHAGEGTLEGVISFVAD
jgi:CRISPR system Cascade subunit CasC